MINVEAENNELILKNSYGDHVIIPAKKRAWVQKKIKEGCDSCIDGLVESLPVLEEYAQDGSVFPSTPLTPTTDEPNISGSLPGKKSWLEAQREQAGVKQTTTPTPASSKPSTIVRTNTTKPPAYFPGINDPVEDPIEIDTTPTPVTPTDTTTVEEAEPEQKSRGFSILRDIMHMDDPIPGEEKQEMGQSEAPEQRGLEPNLRVSLDVSHIDDPTPDDLINKNSFNYIWNNDPSIKEFRRVFQERYGYDPDPYDRENSKYDYEGAVKAGVRPILDPNDGLYHWSSQFKDDDHPNRFIDGIDTKTGKPYDESSVSGTEVPDPLSSSSGIEGPAGPTGYWKEDVDNINTGAVGAPLEGISPDQVPELTDEDMKVMNTEDPSTFLGKVWSYRGQIFSPATWRSFLNSQGRGLTEREEVSSSEIDFGTPFIPTSRQGQEQSGRPMSGGQQEEKIPPYSPQNIEPSVPYKQFVSQNGFKSINPIVSVGRTFRDYKDGKTFSESTIDMSNGYRVTYQPWNEKKSERKNVENAIMVSDYLFDFDFTSGAQHQHAKNQLDLLKKRWEKGDYDTQPFVQVREELKDGTYLVKIKAVKDLTEEDFSENKIYRQSYAKLSDFDMSPDMKKIRLHNYPNTFKNQGIPIRGKQGADHNLRVPGGVGNYGRYQNISELNQYGPYLGGTVTVISQNGKTAIKVAGSLKNILTVALEIRAQQGGGEVYFLQSDAGSMNVKPNAQNGVLEAAQLNIARNNEVQAGAAEILLNY